jgi:hypothetical protein
VLTPAALALAGAAGLQLWRLAGEAVVSSGVPVPVPLVCPGDKEVLTAVARVEDHLLVAGGQGGSVWLVDLRLQREGATVATWAVGAEVTCLSGSGQNGRVMVGSGRGLSLWEMQGQTPVRLVDIPSSPSEGVPKVCGLAPETGHAEGPWC